MRNIRATAPIPQPRTPRVTLDALFAEYNGKSGSTIACDARYASGGRLYGVQGCWDGLVRSKRYSVHPHPHPRHPRHPRHVLAPALCSDPPSSATCTRTKRAVTSASLLPTASGLLTSLHRAHRRASALQVGWQITLLPVACEDLHLNIPPSLPPLLLLFCQFFYRYHNRTGAYVLHSSRSLPRGTSAVGKMVVQCMGVGLLGLAVWRAAAGPIAPRGK